MDDKERKENQPEDPTPENKPTYKPEDDESTFGCIGFVVSTMIVGIKLAILLCVIFSAYIAAVILASIDFTFWLLAVYVNFSDITAGCGAKRKDQHADVKNEDDNNTDIFTDF